MALHEGASPIQLRAMKGEGLRFRIGKARAILRYQRCSVFPRIEEHTR